MALLAGRCVSYGSNIPYLPLAELIRTHCGVRESDPPETARLAVEHTSRNHDLPSESGTWLLRMIGGGDTSGALEAMSPEAVKARTFDALRTLFFWWMSLCKAYASGRSPGFEAPNHASRRDAACSYSRCL